MERLRAQALRQHTHFCHPAALCSSRTTHLVMHAIDDSDYVPLPAAAQGPHGTKPWPKFHPLDAQEPSSSGPGVAATCCFAKWTFGRCFKKASFSRWFLPLNDCKCDAWHLYIYKSFQNTGSPYTGAVYGGPYSCP